MNKITLGLTDLLHQDPLNCSEKHRGTPCFCARAHAMQRACPQGCAYAAISGCSPLLNHALGEDGTSSHRSVAARPIEWQQESLGSSPFPRARSLCTVHVLSAGCLQRCTDARPGQSTHQARMGLGLTDWSHQDPLKGSKKAWGALHFPARACYAMCMSGVDAILKSE